MVGINRYCVPRLRKGDAFRDVADAFVAVIEAHSPGTDGVRKIEPLPVVSGDTTVVGVGITHAGGVDYILSTTQDREETTFVAPGTQQKMTLAGRLGVVRSFAAKPAVLLLLRGARLSDGTATVDQPIGAAALDAR